MVIERIFSGNYDLWVLDLDRGGVGSPITFDPYDERDPIWSPDGRYVAFTSMRSDSQNLYRTFLAGEEEPELLMQSKEGNLHTEDWSDNGRFIAYLEEAGTRNAIGILPLLDDQTPIPVVQGKFDYDEPKFSPDGKWMAYISNETNQNEVYIRPLEGEGEKKRISNGGGGQPQWRGDGKELFYLALDGSMMAVEIRGEQFAPGTPEFLFKTDVIVVPHLDQYAVTDDGQRFIFLTTGQASGVSSINFVVKWFEELKQRVPVD